MTVHIDLDRRKLASLALIPLALVLIAVLTLLDIRAAADPPLLVAILNTVFTGIIPLAIAFIAFRSYRTSGSASLLMLGAGMLIFGLGQVAAGWTIGVYGPNASATISNVCLFFSGCFNMGGALLAFTYRKTARPEGNSWKIAGMVSFVVLLFAVLAVLAIAGLTPAFFAAGAGPTVIRQVVLSYAVAFLALASLLLFGMFARNRDDFFFWYSISLATIATGFIGVFLTSVMGSPVNWVARGMLYIGSVLALVAVMVVMRQARARGSSLEETLGRFFSEAETGYKALIETATDAIVVFDSADRVIVWNRSAEKMFGYSTAEAIGSSFFSLAIPDESAGVIRNNFQTPAAPGTDLGVARPLEITARRKDGSTFPAELALSRHEAAGTSVSTAIIRDITDRRETESELRGASDRTTTILNSISDSFIALDRDWRITFINRLGLSYANKPAEEIIGKIIWDAFPELPGTPLETFYRSAMASQKPGTYVNESIVADRKFFELHAYPLGESGIAVFGQDITDRKRAEDVLRQGNETLSALNEELTTAQEELHRRNEELLRSEHEIAAKNAQMQGLFDYSSASLVLFDAKKPYTVLTHNTYYQKLWAEPFRSNGMVGKNLQDFVPEVELSGVMAVFDEVVATRRARSLVNFPYDGMERGRTYWNWHLSPVIQGGDVVALAHMGIDVTNEVTARMKVEETVASLKVSEESLRLAQEAGHVGVWDWDMLTGVVRWTPELEAIYGLAPGTIRTYQDFHDLVHPGDIGRIERIQATAIDRHKPFEYEFRFMQPDGEVGWVYCRGGAVYDETGKPIRQFGVNLDITEHKKAEEALRESDFRLQVALEAGSLGWHDYTPATGKILRDRNCRAMWGVGPEDPVDINVFWAGIHPDSVAETQAKLAASIDPAGDGRFDAEYLVRSLDGSPYRWVHATGQTIFAGEGADRHPVHVIGTVQDITDRKKAGEALRESEERMRIALEAADLGTWSFDIATGIAEHSLRHDQIFGYPEAVPEWSYEISIRHMLPEFHAVAREAVEEAMKTGTVMFEVQVRWPDGRIHWINPFGRVQYDSGAAPVRMSGVVSDITERRNAQEHVKDLLAEVRREKDRLSSLVNSISDEVWFADTQKNFTLANPSALREFALASGSIDIEKFAASLEVYRPDRSPRPVEEAPPLRALKGEEVRNQEEMIRTPGKGEIRYRQVSANPVRDASGTIVGSVSVVRDITGQKRLEENLQNTLQRFYHVLSGMPYGILLVTGEDRVEFANQAFCDLFGFDEAPSGLHGMTAEEILGKIRPAYRDPDGALARIREIVRLGKPVRGEEVAMGSGRVFLGDFVPIQIGGKVCGRLWIHVEITDRKNAEEALRGSEERFRELAEKAGSIILRFDPAGRITYFNEFAEDFFGFSRDEVLGKPAVGTIIPIVDSSGKDLGQIVGDIVADPDRYATNENENVLKNGERVWVRWTNKPVFNPDGTVREFTTIGFDITERKRVEEALKRSLAEKEVLLSEIHHRVKNNLTAFISLLSLEGSTEETPAGAALKKDLQNRARSMALIHETLYRTHKFDDVDMGVYLTNLLDQIANSFATTRSVKTVVEAKGVVLDIPRATPAGLIVNELVTNSFKYAFPESFDVQAARNTPPTVTIALSKNDGMYELTFRDNGVGLPPGFDPATTQTLGLKLVNFLAKHQMRAKVSVNTENGTEFTFRFKE